VKQWARVAVAYALLHVAAVTLRLFGVQSWLRLLQRIAVQRAPGEADVAVVRAWGTAVRRAEWRSIFKRTRHVNCLPRSLTLCALLSWAGVPCTLRIGAGFDEQRVFRAHAWVEVGGLAVAENPPSGEGYTPFDVAFNRLRESRRQDVVPPT